MSSCVVLPNSKITKRNISRILIVKSSWILIFIVVSAIKPEVENSKGKSVRLSMMEETRESKTRDSLLAPAPRVSEGNNFF